MTNIIQDLIKNILIFGKENTKFYFDPLSYEKNKKIRKLNVA